MGECVNGRMGEWRTHTRFVRFTVQSFEATRFQIDLIADPGNRSIAWRLIAAYDRRPETKSTMACLNHGRVLPLFTRRFTRAWLPNRYFWIITESRSSAPSSFFQMRS